MMNCELSIQQKREARFPRLLKLRNSSFLIHNFIRVGVDATAKHG